MGWNKQPSRFTRLDKANPFARRQCLLAWAASSPGNALDGYSATYDNAPGYSLVRGIGQSRTLATNQSIRWANRFPASTGRDVTLCAIVTLSNTTDSSVRITGVSGTADSNGFAIFLNTGNLSWIKPNVVAGSSTSVNLSANTPYFVAVSYRHSTGAIVIFARNLRTYAVQSDTATNSAAWDTVTTAMFDMYAGTQPVGDANSFTGNILYAATFATTLSLQDLRLLSLKPWQLFKTRPISSKTNATVAPTNSDAMMMLLIA